MAPIRASVVVEARAPTTHGDHREVLALITEGAVVRAILECLGLSAEAPMVHPARGPPELF